MAIEDEKFFAPGKYEIDKSMEETLTKLNEAKPFYLDIANGHNTNKQTSKKNLYTRMHNK